MLVGIEENIAYNTQAKVQARSSADIKTQTRHSANLEKVIKSKSRKLRWHIAMLQAGE